MVASGFGGVLLDFFFFFSFSLLVRFRFEFGSGSFFTLRAVAAMALSVALGGLGTDGITTWAPASRASSGFLFFIFFFDWDTKGCTNELIIKDTNGTGILMERERRGNGPGFWIMVV